MNTIIKKINTPLINNLLYNGLYNKTINQTSSDLRKLLNDNNDTLYKRVRMIRIQLDREIWYKIFKLSI